MEKACCSLSLWQRDDLAGKDEVLVLDGRIGRQDGVDCGAVLDGDVPQGVTWNDCVRTHSLFAG